MKRLRQFLESIAFAGLKPGGTSTPKPQPTKLGPLRGKLERFLSGGAPADPLYLSNRTLGQKIKFWSLVAIPCAILAAGVWVTFSIILDPSAAKSDREPPPAPVVVEKDPLPNLKSDIKLATSDVQVLELKVEGPLVVGSIKNTTTREIGSVELIIDLTNSSGSQVGAVKVVVEKLPASGRKSFQASIPKSTATFALVREVTSQ
jgi:hypothetical protein